MALKISDHEPQTTVLMDLHNGDIKVLSKLSKSLHHIDALRRVFFWSVLQMYCYNETSVCFHVLSFLSLIFGQM